MPNNGLREVEERLLQDRSEVLKTITNREAIQIERASDTLDEIQNASLRDLAVRHLDLEAQRLRAIEKALQRIRDGVYGICEECEEEINPKRLTALPSAALCVRCQERQEALRKVGGDGDPLMEAA